MKLLPLFVVGLAAALKPSKEHSAGVPKSCARLPSDLKLRNQTNVLPDPFHFLDGRRVSTVKDWHCRAAQIRELFQVSRQMLYPFRLGDSTILIDAGV